MSSDPTKRWERIEALRRECRQRPKAEREEYLVDACGDDGALLRDVRELLGAESVAEMEMSPTTFKPGGSTPWVGRTLGDWTIVARLASGGMGDVYRAERAEGSERVDDAPVAIKFVRPGLGTDEILARFIQEGQVLSELESPYIARLLHVGQTEDGDPYLVMEFVDGVPITRYCDEQVVALRARLELFVRVCEGVAHAHRNLVIHRDLKPANILVDEQGVPRLLDFGISKALNFDDTACDITRSNVRLMTPKYASPQQVKGEPVTTQCDVFALGVVLYELVTGLHPHAAAATSRTELERAVLHETPDAPSRTRARADGVVPDRSGLSRRQLRHLDAVAMAALEKEPRERYWTVDELRQDVQRVLDGEAVKAPSETALKRLQRVFAHDRGTNSGLAAAVLMMAVVSALGVAFFRQARRALESERTAWDTAAHHAEEAHAAQRQLRLAETLHGAEESWSRTASFLAEVEQRRRAGQIERARALLDSIPNGHRGWEWSILRARLAGTGSPAAPSLDTAPVGPLRLATAVDAPYFLACGPEVGLRAWHRDSMASVVIHERLPCTAAYSLPVRRLVLVRPNHVEVRDPSSPKQGPSSWKAEASLGEAALSADGRHLLVAVADRSVRVLELPALRERVRLEELSAPARALAVDESGEHAVVLEGLHVLSAWSLREPRLLGRWPVGEGVSSLTLHPGAEWVAVGRDDGELVLLELADGRCAQKVSLGAPIPAVRFTPDGSRVVVSSSDGALDVRRLPGLQRVVRLEGHDSPIVALEFERGGSDLVTCDRQGALRVWSCGVER